jgi:hypothetical protein
LRESAQEQAIYNLNQNVLNAGPTPAEQALIAGWYANQPGSSKVLNKTYIDPSWPTQDSVANSFYQDVYARSCRTCHVALVEGYNFDHYQNIAPGSHFYRADRPEVDVPITACGGDSQILRDHSMANSLVTFNRFWFSSQANELGQFFSTPCNPGTTP